MCIKRGLVAHREVSNELMQECTRKALSDYRKYNIEQMCKEPHKPPMHFKEFPSLEQGSYPANYHTRLLTRRMRCSLRRH